MGKKSILDDIKYMKPYHIIKESSDAFDMVLDEADCFISEEVDYWSICAVEPMLRAMGGRIQHDGDSIDSENLRYAEYDEWFNKVKAARTLDFYELMEERQEAAASD